MLFNWLRTQVKHAVLAGIGDAVAELGGGTDQNEEDADELRQRLQPRLPAPEPEPAEPNGRRAKARA